MAGGVGSRFWPKSRNHFPKQFIDVLGIGKSLLQLTYERFLNICPKENIFILSNIQYSGLIKEQLTDISLNNILLEPCRNNTAPCIAYATYKILELNPDANLIVAPSDHLILKESVFIDKIRLALAYTSSNDALVTLGISPTRPDTGYGYIHYTKGTEKEVFKVNQFLEKPPLEKAKEFLSSGDYLWNAGIFIWSAKSLQRAFKKHVPALDALFGSGSAMYNTDKEVEFINENYKFSPNISIDYAILEKANNVYTIPADIGWSDLGTWASLHSVANKDECNNVLNEKRISLADTNDCIIHIPPGKLAVIKGLKDFIVVDDNKVLLIYPKSDEQEIKQIAGLIVKEYGSEYL